MLSSPDKVISESNATILQEQHEFYKEFSQPNRTYRNDTPASVQSEKTTLTPIMLWFANHHQATMDSIHSNKCTPHTPMADFGHAQLMDSLDCLAAQQTQYFVMMTQANAHILAQLQQLVITMQPFVEILSLQEGASTPLQTPENLPTTGSIIPKPDPKLHQSANNYLSHYPETINIITTTAMNLVTSPLAPGVVNTPVPI